MERDIRVSQTGRPETKVLKFNPERIKIVEGQYGPRVQYTVIDPTYSDKETKHLSMEVKQQLEWRGSKVLELSSQGYSEREISEILKVSDSAVHRDLVFVRRQAKENLQKHIHDVVPEEYQKCMVGMKRNLKQTLEIADTTADPRVRLQARAIANDCYRHIMDLCTNAGIVSDATKFVERKREQLHTLHKIDARMGKIQEEEKKEEEKTTNGVI
jgi:hypothetical protein